MRISEILGMIKRYFLLGFIVVLVLGIIISIGYFIVYKKILGGRKKFNKKQIMIIAMFLGYIVIVIGVTFLNRGAGIFERVNFHLLSTYREAWNTFNTRNWQLIIMNILLFVPLGFFLPKLHNKFYNIGWTLTAGLILTLIIECLQYSTGFGIFDLDDIFNNILGTAIGYSIVMSIITAFSKQKHKGLNVFVHLSPTIVVLAIFIGIFAYYNSREFGNLSVAYNYRINMKDAKISTDLELNNDKVEIPIYKAPTYNKETAKEFAIDFLKNINISTDDLEIIDYSDTSIYWVREEPTYNIWVNYLDGSYRYKDFSSSDEDIEEINVEEDTLVKSLEKFNIDIPPNAIFNSIDTGSYEWKFDMKIKEDYLIDGILSCTYYNDDKIKNISNNLIVYKKVGDVTIISETEAFERLIDGKFKQSNLSSDIKTIDIIKVNLDYKLDSKGFLQPVYLFFSLLNGEETTIIIPALIL